MKVKKIIKSLMADYWRCGAGLMWVSFALLIIHNFLFMTWRQPISQKLLFSAYRPLVSSLMGIIASTILLFHPRMYRFYAGILICISVPLLVDSALSPIGVILYCLALFVLIHKKLINQHKPVRYALLIILFVLSAVSGIRFGVKQFFFNAIISSVVVLTTFFLVSLTLKETDKVMSQLSIENKSKESLAEYFATISPELSARDIEWLICVANGEKYESIAKDYKLSHNYVRNRMSKIYKLIKVSDYHEFLSRYKNFL